MLKPISTTVLLASVKSGPYHRPLLCLSQIATLRGLTNEDHSSSGYTIQDGYFQAHDHSHGPTLIRYHISDSLTRDSVCLSAVVASPA